MAKTKDINATELHKPIRNRKPKTLQNATVAGDVLHNATGLTPAASRLARSARLESVGIDAILARLSTPGQSFRLVAAWLDVPTVDLWTWIRDDPARERAYNMATEARAHGYVEEAHDLADRVVEGELDPRRADVKIKLVQWSASRTQAYQERKTVEHTVTHKLDLDDLKSRLGQLVDVAANRVIEGSCTTIAPDSQ